MGLTQSLLKQPEEEEEGDGEDEEQQEDGENAAVRERHGNVELEEKKVDMVDELEQEPELVPFASSASPSSPQVSSVTTPHLGPAVRVWDPGHVLSPSPAQGRGFNGRAHIPPGAFVGDEICTEVYLIRSGESNLSALPELIGGRSPSAMLTAEGKRQARALGVFLLSHGLHFDVVFSSPLERCKQTAVSVCQEVNFPQERIQFGDALVEMSQGLWEGLRRFEIYTAELLNVKSNSHPDFHAPGGESQRQVEFRIVEFINNVVLPKAVEANLHKDGRLYFKKQIKSNSLMQVHPLDDAEEAEVSGAVMPLAKHSSLLVKGAGKSRLHISSGAGDTVASGRQSWLEQKAAPRAPPYYVAVFSHGMAIKCLLRALLGSDSHMTDRLCIDSTSMTVLRHSTYYGWQIQRVNDTAHLRLL